MRHVALVTCPYPAAAIKSIDKSAALAMPGVHYVLDGRELAAATLPLMTGLDTPERAAPAAGARCRALCRRMGGGRGRRHARARRGRRREGEDRLREAAVRARRRTGDRTRRRAGASGARLQRAARQDLRVGRGRAGFQGQPAPSRAAGEMGPQRHGADRDLRRGGELGPLARAARRLRLDPDAALCRPDRHRAENSGDLGARASRRRCRRQLRRQARHQAHRARRLSGAPARLPGAADRGSPGEHARRRRARAGAAVRRRGGVRRQRHRAFDEDARAGECRRLCRALAVPARQADRRHRRALQDQKRAVPRHSRGHQQDHAGGGARLRPGADQCGARAHHGRGGERASARPAGDSPAQHDPARGIPLHHPERHHLRQRRLSHRHRQGACRYQLRRAQERARPPARRRQARRHRHRRLPGAVGRQRQFRGAAQSGHHHLDLHGFLPHQCGRHGHDHRHHAHHVVRPGPRDAARHRDRRGVAGRSRQHPGDAAGFARTRCRAARRSAAAWRSCSAAPRSMPRTSSRPN